MTHAATRRIFGQVYANLPSRFILEAQLLDNRQPAGQQGRGMPPSSARATGFRVGMRVKHPTFGVGSVTDTFGSGEAIKVTVHFDDGRTTKLLVRYAPLEPA